MTYNADIHRYANDLVKEHGEAAPIHAAMPPHTLPAQGDRSAYAPWRRIGTLRHVTLSNTATPPGLVR